MRTHAFVAAVTVAGLLAAVHTTRTALFQLPWDQLPSALLFVALAAVLQLMPVALAGESQVSVAWCMAYAAALVWGPGPAVWAGVAFGIAGSLWPKWVNTERIAFNLGVNTLGTFAMAQVVQAAGADLGPAVAFSLRFLVAPATYFVLVTGLLAVVIGLSSRRSPLRVWHANFRWTLLQHMLLSPLGVAIWLMYVTIGSVGVVALQIPLVMARYSLKLYMDKTREVETHVRTLEETNGRLDQKVRELAALHRIALAIGSTLGVQDTLRVILDLADEAAGFAFAFILLRDEKGGVHPGAARGEPAAWGFDPWGEACQRAALQTAAAGERATLPIPGAPAGGPDAVVLVPLMMKGTAVGVMGLGCDPAHLAEIDHVVTVFTGQAAVAIANARVYEETQQLAITDGLTGIYNHRHFLAVLDQAAAQAATQPEAHVAQAIVLIDLDNFKQFNDGYGHAVGDAVLCRVARTIAACVRPGDVPARYGGDEFVILLRDASLDAAQAVARLIKAELDRPEPCAGHVLTIGASFGVAAVDGGEPGLRLALTAADAAAYRAKARGKGCIVAANAPATNAPAANSPR